MSEKILNAMMQLFAIVANKESLGENGKRVVEAFLAQLVSLSLRKKYLDFFNEQLFILEGKKASGEQVKRVSANSVKVLKICTQINEELDQKQKYFALTKLIEFANSVDDFPGEQEREFIETVASVFNISNESYKLLNGYCTAKNKEGIPDDSNILLVQNAFEHSPTHSNSKTNTTLDGTLAFIYIPSEGMVFVRYFGTMDLRMNGQSISDSRTYVFSQGSVIRESKLLPVYHGDVTKIFLKRSNNDAVSLDVNMVQYCFPEGRIGLHPLTFSANSGNLVGIMGGSGAGKSTLLNILNGNLLPQLGEVLINGISIHEHKNELIDLIGYIPQDDLLIEELTVFQNLFFNTKLALPELSDDEIRQKVHEQLESIGLWETKDLKVGSVLNKTLSGGQRKRVNIALELIRKPSILFIDEPTSGLSSMDSENVMDLLKQLTLQGKLIFVVIHQPSSDIFKLFDKLLILDLGGYPAYYGNPSDSLLYFKKVSNIPTGDSSECESCGNINPELVFSIIENKVYNEFGKPTNQRRIKPEEWYHYFEDTRLPNTVSPNRGARPKSKKTKRSISKQIQVFLQRDLLSKIKNKQYLLINLLEAPILALVLAWFLKYQIPGQSYVFQENMNLPVFMFMSVIVALFLGITVSAEEIFRDKKILKREEFLDLSRGGYLFSKIVLMALISAIQTALFVGIGNWIFEINGMFGDYWAILFSVSLFGNLLGLNISATFNSAVTIYILIPFLVIPQIIFSGVMVKYDNMNPKIATSEQVPFIGDIMAARWAFEALAVNQFKNNTYQTNFFELDKRIADITYKKDYWLDRMNGKIDSLGKGEGNGYTRESIIREMKKENLIPSSIITILNNKPSLSAQLDISKQLKVITKEYKSELIQQFKTVKSTKDQLINELNNTPEKAESFKELKQENYNEQLEQMLAIPGSTQMIVEQNGAITRLYKPIYMEGNPRSFVRSPLFVSKKSIGGKMYSTYSVNMGVIWLMIAVLTITLYFDVWEKALAKADKLSDRTKVWIRNFQK